MEFPFQPTRLSPSKEELEWLGEWLARYGSRHGKVLEFGCGITTWVINEAVKPLRYVAVEDSRFISNVQRHLPNVEIIATSWHDIPRDDYDIVFIDSSAGNPERLPGVQRHKAAKYARSMGCNALFIIHDWRGPSGREVRQYLEDEGYRLIACCHGRTGIGVYRNPRSVRSCCTLNGGSVDRCSENMAGKLALNHSDTVLG